MLVSQWLFRSTSITSNLWSNIRSVHGDGSTYRGLCIHSNDIDNRQMNMQHFFILSYFCSSRSRKETPTCDYYFHFSSSTCCEVFRSSQTWQNCSFSVAGWSDAWNSYFSFAEMRSNFSKNFTVYFNLFEPRSGFFRQLYLRFFPSEIPRQKIFIPLAHLARDLVFLVSLKISSIQLKRWFIK